MAATESWAAIEICRVGIYVWTTSGKASANPDEAHSLVVPGGFAMTLAAKSPELRGAHDGRSRPIRAP